MKEKKKKQVTYMMPRFHAEPNWQGPHDPVFAYPPLTPNCVLRMSQLFKVVLEHTAEGTLPPNPELLASVRAWSDAGNDEGSPVNWLASRCNSTREEKDPTDEDMVPERLFEERSSVCNDF